MASDNFIPPYLPRPLQEIHTSRSSRQSSLSQVMSNELEAAEQALNELEHNRSTEACDAIVYFADPEITQLNMALNNRLSFNFEESNEEDLDRFISESLADINHHSPNSSEHRLSIIPSNEIQNADLDAFLNFKEEDQEPLSSRTSEMYGSYQVQTQSDKLELDAEIISAKLNLEVHFSKRHILYSVLVRRSRGLENFPCVVERRYTDFALLYKEICTLRNEFTTIDFPRKQLYGNFRPDVITRRSAFFAKFLNLILVDDQLINSDGFIRFLLEKDLHESALLLRECNYDDAIESLENCYFCIRLLLLRLGGILHFYRYDLIFIVLASIICCLYELDKAFRAPSFVDKLLDLCETHPQLYYCELIVPTLLLSIKIYSKTRKDYSRLNRKLLQLSAKGVRYERAEDLLQLIKLHNYLKIDNLLLHQLLQERKKQVPNVV